MNFERITKYQNWLVEKNDGYYCTHCKTHHIGSHRKNKKEKCGGTVYWQCPSCKLYLAYKKTFTTHVGWGTVDHLHTVGHVAKISTGKNHIHIRYFRVDKYYKDDMVVTSKEIMRDTLENGKGDWTREIKGIRGDMFHDYRVVDNEDWRKSTKGLETTQLGNLYLGRCDLSKNGRYKHMPFRKYFDAAFKGGYGDLRNISKLDYRDELLIKHGTYHLVMTSFDWALYKKHIKVIKKWKVPSQDIEWLNYTNDGELITLLPYKGRITLLKNCDATTLKSYLKKVGGHAILYSDYLDMTQEIYGTLKKRKYPKDLKAAHDELIRLTRLKDNSQFDEAIQAQATGLAGYVYANEIYIIAPIQNIEDLSIQGKELNHCITMKHYVENYANGVVGLYKVTRIRDQKRIATLEVSENHVSQARVVNNMDLPLDLHAFIKHYETEVLR